MARLPLVLVERYESFAHRVVDVTEVLEKQRRSRRIIDQMTGAGTSSAANLCEASEAVSRKDFCKCLGTVSKELAESWFWLRFAAKRGWIKSRRLDPLIQESEELRKIAGAMMARTRVRDREKRPGRT